MRMHPDEVEVDAALVRRLVASQMPRWAGLEVQPVASAGTDHALFRLGSDVVARLPRIPAAVAQVEKEQRWLPVLAPHLPLPIRSPLAVGEPAHGFPWRWSVYAWLPRRTPGAEELAGSVQAAAALGAFVAALRGLATRGDPSPGSTTSSYATTNPALAASARRAIVAAIDDHRRG